MDEPTPRMNEDTIERGRRFERSSASAQIYEDLRHRILSLEIPPGTNLLRTQLASHYDVSQTPLRDALQRLEHDGLIRTYPQSRTLVTRIDTNLVREGHFLRIALETEVVRHLATECDSETLERAGIIIEMQRSLIRKGNRLRHFQELDEEFHRTLFLGLGYPNLHQLIQTSVGHLERVRRLQRHSAAKLQSILAGHV